MTRAVKADLDSETKNPEKTAQMTGKIPHLGPWMATIHTGSTPKPVAIRELRILAQRPNETLSSLCMYFPSPAKDEQQTHRPHEG